MTHFDTDQYDDHPFKKLAIPVLKNVFEEFKIVLDYCETFGYIPKAILEVKTFLQVIMQTIQFFIFPCFRWGIEDIEVFSDPIF